MSPILIYFVILIPGVQNMAGNFITANLSDNIGSEVSIKNIRFSPIKELVINELLIKDTSNDTLIFVDEVNASIDSIVFKTKTIHLGRITINELKTRIIKDSLQTNLQFILDSVFKQKSTQAKWHINTREVWLKNSSISYLNKFSPPTKTKFNAGNIQLSSVHLLIDQINISQDSVSANIKTFSAQDHSGVRIKDTKGKIDIGKNNFSLKKLRISANHSYLSIDHFDVSYDSTSIFKDFAHKVPFHLKINSLSADHRDFALFIPNFPELHDRINLKGSFLGTVSDLKGKDIYINAGSKTELQTNFDITGLPNILDSYIYLNVKKLSTNMADLTKITSLNPKTEDFKFPESFNQMGDIEYSGKFSGFVDNLVAFGRFKTDLGILKTDIGFKITDENKLVYSGFLNTESFNIGQLMNSSENLNKVTMDVSIQGYRTKDYQFNSYLKGTIDSIDFKKYKYEKMILNGLLSNKRFDGEITLNDPNAQLDFNGKVDFKNEIPEFDFVASLENVRLDKLNLAPKLTNSIIKLKLKSQLSGKNLNDIIGDIVLYDGQLITEDNNISLDTLVIRSTLSNGTKQLSIESDAIDAQLTGSYQLKTLPKELKAAIAQFLPSLVPASDNTLDNTSNYTFSVYTKKLAYLIKTIMPDMVISDGSSLLGHFNAQAEDLQMEAKFGELKYKNISGDKVSFNMNTNQQELTTNFDSELLAFGNILPLHNFSISQKAKNDSMMVNLFWNNEDNRKSSGAIYTQTKFNRTFDGTIYSLVDLFPSSITINDTTWKIQESSVNITPHGLRINTFRIWHINQEININGSLFNRGTSKLTTNFQNINIGEITQSFNTGRLKFDGILNGHVEIKENLHSPIITSNLQLDNLIINDEDIGHLFIESNWDQDSKSVLLNTQIRKKEITPLIGKGYFKPSTNDYNFNFELDSLPIGFLDLYLSKVMQNLKGTASGNIGLRKTTYGLGLEGGVKINKARFDVDLIKCSYFLEDSVTFTPESISFNNMTVTDPNGKKGSFIGSIYHHNFYNMSYDLYLRVNNMLVLNSQANDNPLYYGTVYGTGDLVITGTTYDLNININAKTEKNTRFFIPMSDRQESLNNNFIQFIQPSDTLNSDKLANEEEYKIDLANYKLNMSIEITPDAQVQVIFDPALGDILKSTGKGDLQIKTNKEGNISFFGDYVAEDGDYLFSLENVVNKRFDINEGGTVIWEGDPYDALIDLTATYKLKTSLQPLILPSSAENTENGDIYRRVPINCDMILSNRLSKPTIQFGISAPTMEQSTQNLIEDAISTEEELNRQVLSLLVLSKFYTPDYNASNTSGTGVNSAAIANTSEVLSSQLSNWLSQISNDFDVGISYRPEDEISSEQIEVALSTQIFNDRVTLNGNVEYGKYNQTQQNSSNIVGDFDMEVKLNKSGSLRAKAYTHSNDDFSIDNSPTTEGVGISYHEEFNTFGELIQKYWNWITGKAKKEKEIKLENTEEESNTN